MLCALLLPAFGCFCSRMKACATNLVYELGQPNHPHCRALPLTRPSCCPGGHAAGDQWETVVEITGISEYTNPISRRRRRLEQAGGAGAGAGIVVDTAITLEGLPGSQPDPAAALGAEAAMQQLLPALQDIGSLLPPGQFGAVAAGGFKLSSVSGAA